MIRWVVFGCGLVALAYAIALGVAIAMQPAGSEGIMKAANAERPWIHRAIGSSLLGFLLCFAGEGRWRFFSLVLALVVMAWWYGAWMVLPR
jgi:hypothetical protein